MRKKLYEDVETVYKVYSLIFSGLVEETEEFDNKEDAMEYAHEQISSGNYDEVIVSEVTIDEDGYEDETILLDSDFYKQGEHEDDEEYEPQLTTDRMHAGQWYESFKSKDKYSVLREALDRLDREDNKGKKSKARAQIRNLRSKLKESKTDKDLKRITESKEDKIGKVFDKVCNTLIKRGYIVEELDYNSTQRENLYFEHECIILCCARKRNPNENLITTTKIVKNFSGYLAGCFG